MSEEGTERLLLQVGVKILIKNRRGEYLLLHRSATKYPEVLDVWDIPGGRINPGSLLHDNLVREVREETGLVLQGKPVLVAAQDIMKLDKHVVRLTYLGGARGNIVLDTEENDAYQWASLGTIRKMKDLDVYLKSVILKLKT